MLFRTNYWNYLFHSLIVISLLISVFTMTSQLKFFSWVFDGENLIVNRGIFFKKRVTLSRSNIKGLQVVSPWYFKLFKIYSLKIKLPSVGDSESIKFSVIDEIELKKFQAWYGTKKITEVKVNTKNLVNVKISRLILSSIFTLNYLYLLTILNFLDKGLKYFKISLFDMLFIQYKNIFFLSIIIFSGILSSFIKQFLDYYKLEMYLDDQSIHIRNGLLSSDYVKIKLTDIIGYKVSQNIGQRLLGLWSLKAIVINYNVTGAVSKVTRILPFATLREIKQFEYEVYGEPTFVIDENLNQSNYNFKIIVLLILFITCGLFSVYWLMLTILIFIRLGVLYNRKYEERGTKLVFKSTFISSSSTIIKDNNLEWKEVTTIFPKVYYLKMAYTYNPLKVFRCLEMRKQKCKQSLRES